MSFFNTYITYPDGTTELFNHAPTLDTVSSMNRKYYLYMRRNDALSEGDSHIYG